ncbi:MAG: cbb3-type cytochrome oxidase assembly protein CcoS [Flavobacteriales bacterium]|nr:cbb3-type cytochrome oxidase assembly protein CcoS [Flavobacteriales bacterium]
MSVIFLLLTISTLMAGIFLLAFIRSVRKGQYDDDRSPAVRILLDDPAPAAGPAHVPITHPIANEPT